VLKLALPIVLANLSVPLVGVVDTAVMGHMTHPVFIAATAIGATLFSSIYWLFGFLRMGTAGLVAQEYGRSNQSDAALTTLRGMLLASLIAVVLFILQTPILHLSLALFETNEQLRSLTTVYYQIRICSAPATLLLYVVLGTLVGLQKMRALLYLQLLLNLLNIFLNILFFNFTDLAIAGVALATVISEYTALVVGLIMVSRNLSLTLPAWMSPALWDKAQLLNLLSVNANLFVRTLCLIASFYWLTIAGSRFGTDMLAANTILMQFLNVMAHALDGFAHTAESLGGYAYGKKDKRQFLQAIRISTEWGLLFSILFSVLYALFGGIFIGLMTDIPHIASLAMEYMPWVIIAPVISIASFLLDGIYIGVTHTRDMRNAMLVSLLVFLLSSWVLTHFFGNHGLWAAFIVLMICRGITLSFWFPRILFRFQR